MILEEPACPSLNRRSTVVLARKLRFDGPHIPLPLFARNLCMTLGAAEFVPQKIAVAMASSRSIGVQDMTPFGVPVTARLKMSLPPICSIPLLLYSFRCG